MIGAHGTAFKVEDWKRERALEQVFGGPQHYLRPDSAWRIHVYRLPDNTLKIMPRRVEGAIEPEPAEAR